MIDNNLRGTIAMIDELLKNNKKAIGIKQVTKAIECNQAEIVLIAMDAEEKITKSLKELCNSKGCKVILAESMKELGKCSGIDVGASVVCILY
jgi:large subunit ribosomal protein L7A